MSLNTAHSNGGVLIYQGELILLYSENVSLQWSGPDGRAFRGTKKGTVYLTTHRMIFISKSTKDEMRSFSFPYITVSEVKVEQPVFGANYVRGIVQAQPNGNWTGEATFKLTFKDGGAVEFGQSVLKLSQLSLLDSRYGRIMPPAYVAPQTEAQLASPPTYTPPPHGYHGWRPPANAFRNHPPAGSVFVNEEPPPYPGIQSAQNQSSDNTEDVVQLEESIFDDPTYIARTAASEKPTPQEKQKKTDPPTKSERGGRGGGGRGGGGARDKNGQKS